jgi:regulatory protein
VVRRLRSLNYLNDEVFARNLALWRAQSSGHGPRRIEQELRSKGIDPSITREALRETFNQMDEGERARRLLAKQFKSASLTEPKVARRAAAFLQRRGYSSKVIFNLLRYPIEED